MSLNATATVALAGGYWRDGVCHRQAVLRPLTGADEAFLVESPGLSPARRTTAVLARCLVRLGSRARAGEEAVRSLSVGDREALVLHLRRLTLGERIDCVLVCGAPGCGEKMDLELSVEGLLPPTAPRPPSHELTLEADGRAYHITFRLPTGADQEAAARVAPADPEAAAELLLARCVERIEDDDGGPVERLPAALAEPLAAAMAELDPQAELRLDVRCPSCDAPATVLFDAALYFFDELAQRSARLYREVHTLALHYHWSEAEILGMTAAKRARYLALLDEALAEDGAW